MIPAVIESLSGETLVSGDAWLDPKRPGLATLYPYGDQALQPGDQPAAIRIDGQQPRRIVHCYPCPGGLLHYHLGFDYRD